MSATDKPNLPDLRVSYDMDVLLEESLPEDPLELFRAWLDDAMEHQIKEPNAMCLSTIGLDGTPRGRTVLLKGLDQRGFHFYTNYHSQKGREIAANPRACATFLWRERHHQVAVRGLVLKLPAADSDAYFQSRPYGHQIGAWVSDQSIVIPDRDWLEQREREAREKHPEGDVPRPDHWGGYTLQPDEIEFWQGRVSRLHDRILYREERGQWVRCRLSP